MMTKKKYNQKLKHFLRLYLTGKSRLTITKDQDIFDAWSNTQYWAKLQLMVLRNHPHMKRGTCL
jgi:hypothetical protein